jgi:primosomal protein N' (replication factor Y)
VGQRVRVPFRGRSRPAVVVERADGLAAGLAPIEAVLDPVPALTPALLALTRWAATETVSAWGEAVARALPPAARASAPAGVPPEAPSRAGGSLTLVTGGERTARVEAAIETSARCGGGALVLVPEIEAAGEWARRLAARLGERPGLLTSAESPRRRWETWWACRAGTCRVVVGTRAAAFAPVPGLSLGVVVDEEDPAHKAPDAPRWHSRELAIERLGLEGGQGLLVSAAPSLETWARVETGGAVLEEAPGVAWPTVHRVDLRATPVTRSLTPALREAARAALAGGGSVLLVLNRLGYGRVLSCADCGAVRWCQTCRVPLAYHREARALVCQLCGARSQARSLCGRCRGRRLLALGAGTERLEAEARAAFPEAVVVRYDGTLTADRAASARGAFRTGRARVVVGTLMAARLLRETPVALASLVLADTILNVPDFRAAERTFQLAWRLAEGVAPGGSLWIQSFLPDHPALAAVAAGAPRRFYAGEWAERRELGYPPARRMGRLVVTGPGGGGLAEDLAARSRTEGLTVLGPARVPGGGAQVIVLGDRSLPSILSAVLAPLRGRRRLAHARVAVDVDPVEPT